MSLRNAAKAAFEASQNDRVGEARAALIAVLGDPEGYVTGLTVTDGGIEATDTYTLIVFTDGDIHLGARARAGQAWTVELMDRNEYGGWRRLADIESLEHLGKVVDDLDPPEAEETYPAWVQPTGAHDAYAAGDRVTHNGKTWESTTAGNVWEPGVSGWREIV